MLRKDEVMSKPSQIKPIGRIALGLSCTILAVAFTGFVGVAYQSATNSNAKLDIPSLNLPVGDLPQLKADLPSAYAASQEEETSTEEVEEKPTEEVQTSEQVTETEPVEQVEEPIVVIAEPAPEPEPAPVVVQQTAVAGTCQDWMNAAGIADQASAYALIMRESSCNPNAVNPSSGACGIGQQLPCGKWEHQWNDPVGAMIDMQNYVFARYGSWANALQFHYANGWY